MENQLNFSALRRDTITDEHRAFLALLVVGTFNAGQAYRMIWKNTKCNPASASAMASRLLSSAESRQYLKALYSLNKGYLYMRPNLLRDL